MPAARQVSSLLTPNTHGAKTVTGPSFQTRKPGVRVAPVTPWKVAEPGRPPRGVPWAPPPRNRGLAWKEKGHFRPPGSGPPLATVPGVPGATERSLRAGRWQPLSTEAEAEPRPGLSPRPRCSRVHLAGTRSPSGSALSLLVLRRPQVRKALRPPYHV